jgi:hypothetical protein
MKFIKLFLIILALFLLVKCNRSSDTQPAVESNRPGFRKQNGNIQLLVEKEPFLILGGQLLNSSASNLNNLDPAWDSLKVLNLNTVILPITWQQFEPVEGEFNYYLVDGLISKAREYKLRLVLLWYGSWKNGMSGYVPQWVITDPEKYPRMTDENGKSLEILTCFGKNNRAADVKAFSQLMKHLKEVDQKRNTVILVQIEDKVGIPGCSRDYSSLAEIAFQQNVPAELIEYLETNIDKINPLIRDLWKSHHYKKDGTWEEVFGNNKNTDEIFMAWHYSQYINEMAEKGKAEYRLPVYVNGFVPKGDICESEFYLSGGPDPFVLDIWKAGAPAIDFYAPVLYYNSYKSFRQDFMKKYNPLFISEACAFWESDTVSAAAKAFYIIGQRNSIGFAPFGIDHALFTPKHSIAKAYHVLNSLSSFILEAKVNDNIQSFMQENNATDTCKFDNFTFIINYKVKKPEGYPGFGIVIKMPDDEFIVAGNGCNITFMSSSPENPYTSLVWVEEGEFIDGEWKTKRVLGGDETISQGTSGIMLPPDHYNREIDMNHITVQKIKLFQHK